MARVIAIMNINGTEKTDIDIPTDVTADELLFVLNKIYRKDKPAAVALRTDNPISYLSGNMLLEDEGIHNGTQIYFVED